MLLKTIVAKLDAELDRLQTLRQIVDGISSISPVDGLLMELIQLQPGSKMTSLSSSLPTLPSEASTLLNKVSGPARSRRQPEPRALASNIPVSPVAISAAQVASERQRRGPQKAANRAKLSQPRSAAGALPSPEALRNRWLSGS